MMMAKKPPKTPPPSEPEPERRRKKTAKNDFIQFRNTADERKRLANIKAELEETKGYEHNLSDALRYAVYLASNVVDRRKERREERRKAREKERRKSD